MFISFISTLMVKYALIIAINYINQKGELSGCINDGLRARKMFIDVYGYEPSNIVFMSDFSKIRPTLKNMREQFRLLVNKTKDKNGNKLPEVTNVRVHYSGHGSHTRDLNGDETDGQDECLIPLDYEFTGEAMMDDELNEIFAGFPRGLKVQAWWDACHSETILDTRFKYRSGVKSVEENKNSKIVCDLISLSGCKDRQVSMDAYNMLNAEEYSGAMSSAGFYVLYSRNHNLSLWEFIRLTQKYLKRRGFNQVPCICTSIRQRNGSMFALVDPTAYETGTGDQHLLEEYDVSSLVNKK